MFYCLVSLKLSTLHPKYFWWPQSKHCHFCNEAHHNSWPPPIQRAVTNRPGPCSLPQIGTASVDVISLCTHRKFYSHDHFDFVFSKGLRLSDLITNNIFPHCSQLLDAIPYCLYICA